MSDAVAEEYPEPKTPYRTDPHMRIAHTVFEAIYKAPISRLDCQVFCLLLRWSWGFDVKTLAISSERISRELQIPTNSINRAIARLLRYNMVTASTVSTKNNPATYRPNKLYFRWIFGDGICWSPKHRIFRNDVHQRPECQPEEEGNDVQRCTSFVQRCTASEQRCTAFSENDTDFSLMASGPTGDRENTPKESTKETLKENPPTPQGDEAGGDDSCLNDDELIDPEVARRNALPGSIDKSKLAAFLTVAQVKILQSTCLQDLQRVEPVLVPRAKAKLDEYLSTLPPKEWTASPQRWASHLRHWIQIGVSDVQGKIRELMGMSEDYKAAHRVRCPADMAIQIAARLCGEKLAEFSEDEAGGRKTHATRI